MYLPAVKCRAFDIFVDYTVRVCICINYMAGYLLSVVEHIFVRQNRKGKCRAFSRLFLEPRKIDALTFDTCRSSRLETHKCDALTFECRVESVGCQKPVGTRCVVDVSDKDPTTKVCSRADYCTFAFPYFSHLSGNRYYSFLSVFVCFCGKIHHFGLNESEIFGLFKRVLHDALIFSSVCLNSL